MLHQFPAVYVDLDIEREPCLDLDEHELEFPVQIIEVIVETFGPGGFQELLPRLANDLCGCASLQRLQDTDEPLVHESGKKNPFRNVLFSVLSGRQVYNRAPKFLCRVFNLFDQAVRDVPEIPSEVPQRDAH